MGSDAPTVIRLARPRSVAASLLAFVLGGSSLSAQDVQGDVYLDATASAVHAAARDAWERMEQDVLSYTAVVKQRLAVDLRLPLKDRTLYRSESASRVFWNRDGGAVVQVLGAREWHPGYDREDEEPDWDDGMTDAVFDPGGERLTFGLGSDDDVWFEHPLGRDAPEHYRFRTGDTLTLTLPDGRRVQAVQLEVLPREADIHRISGSLWIEPGSGALVRAVYRLSDIMEAGVQRSRGNVNIGSRPSDDEDARDAMKFVPGIFRPITFEMTLIAVEYSLWDFRVWLPRSMRVEGSAAAGILKVPVAVEMSYRIESVVTEQDLEDPASDSLSGATEERHFRTRTEALRYLAELAGEPDMAFVPEDSIERRGRRPVRYLVPVDLEYLRQSPHLPPPIWEEAPGFPTEDQLEELLGELADLPSAPIRTSWAFAWGHQRPDLLRYNRVEGLSVGARLQGRVPTPVGPLSLELAPFFGTADVDPKVRATVEHETLRRKVTLGLYRELEPMSRGGRHLALGNSATALLFGRDEGEYFMATGADLRITPPSARRASWELRLYAEEHDSVQAHTKVTLAHAFDDGWTFRPNAQAVATREAGAQLHLSPWWGTDPLAPQAGIELFAHGAAGDLDYGRASLHLRGAVPFLGGKVKAGLEVGAGESWGDVPLQRNWFLGGSSTLRGYDASTLVGPSFGRGRAEVARVFSVASVAVFGDAGWAGSGLDAFDADDALLSLGVGFSVLDGVIRLDVARGLRDPRATRWDLYLDGIF